MDDSPRVVGIEHHRLESDDVTRDDRDQARPLMTKQFSRGTLGLAAEYAVAAELCRRGIYAQLTLGHQKRTDILVLSEAGEVARVEVKAKQGARWPNCRGISGRNAFLVFVDYQHRDSAERPDFYVLSAKDWRKVLEERVAEIRSANPKKRITITDENVSVFEDEIGRSGRPYQGISIRPGDVSRHREKWEKVARAVACR